MTGMQYTLLSCCDWTRSLDWSVVVAVVVAPDSDLAVWLALPVRVVAEVWC